MKAKTKTNTTEIKKIITEGLGWYFLNQTGYRKINGGYADVEKLKIKKLKQENWYNVKGYVVYGEDDTGDGHSVRYTDEMNLNIRVEGDKITKLEDGEEYEEDDEDD